MKSIFEFKSYKQYLTYRASDEFRERGLMGQMAKAAGCQHTFLSQVINKTVHLNHDQGYGLCRFWSFSDLEADYFLLLIDYERASSSVLKTRIMEKLNTIITSSSVLSKRIKTPSLASVEAQATYYSHWLLGAIHIATSIPEFRTIKNLSMRFSIDDNTTISYLEKLSSLGLVEKKDNLWNMTGASIHLPQNSLFNVINHQNWRHHAISNAGKSNKDSTHYSSVFSMSKTDYLELRNILLKFIDDIRNKISSSPEEDVYCFCCDLFHA